MARQEDTDESNPSGPACIITDIKAIYGFRYCSPQDLDEVDYRNGLENADMLNPVNIMYLVFGHFKANNDRDVNGFFHTRWMSLADLYHQLKEEAEHALLAFEASIGHAREDGM